MRGTQQRDVVGIDVGKGQYYAMVFDRNGKHLYTVKALPNDETKLSALIVELKIHGRFLFVADRPSSSTSFL